MEETDLLDDGPYNIRYIEVEHLLETTAVRDGADTEKMENLRTDLTKINPSAHSPATGSGRPGLRCAMFVPKKKIC